MSPTLRFFEVLAVTALAVVGPRADAQPMLSPRAPLMRPQIVPPQANSNQLFAAGAMANNVATMGAAASAFPPGLYGSNPGPAALPGLTPGYNPYALSMAGGYNPYLGAAASA